MTMRLLVTYLTMWLLGAFMGFGQIGRPSISGHCASAAFVGLVSLSLAGPFALATHLNSMSKLFLSGGLGFIASVGLATFSEQLVRLQLLPRDSEVVFATAGLFLGQLILAPRLKLLGLLSLFSILNFCALSIWWDAFASPAQGALLMLLANLVLLPQPFVSGFWTRKDE